MGLSAGPEELAAAIGKHQDLPLLEAVVAGFVEVSDSPVRRSELRLILGTPALRASWLAAGRAAQEDLVGIVRQHFPAITVFEAQARAAAIISILTWCLRHGPPQKTMTSRSELSKPSACSLTGRAVRKDPHHRYL